jgi:hypothetical protein
MRWLLDFWKVSAPLITNKKLRFAEIPGLSPCNKRDKNDGSRHCVKASEEVKCIT